MSYSDFYHNFSYKYLREALLFKAYQMQGAKISSYVLPSHKGIENETLACDVINIGSPLAPNVFVLTAGLHGMELPYYSQKFQDYIYQAKELTDIYQFSKKIRFTFVHALNPFGASYGLRTDQNNVDLNRNFIDFRNPPKTSEHYAELAACFAPPSISKKDFTSAFCKILKFGLVTHSIGAFKQALAGGQYDFPDGLYYGGREASWSNKTWRTIVHNDIVNSRTKTVAHCDLHTGDGAYAQAALLVSQPKGSATHNLLTGARTPISQTQTAFANLSGDIVDYWGKLGVSEQITVMPFALEIGTTTAPSAIEGIDVLYSLMMRNALRQRHNDRHKHADKVIEKARAKFYPQDRAWRDKVDPQVNATFNQICSAVISCG